VADALKRPIQGRHRFGGNSQRRGVIGGVGVAGIYFEVSGGENYSGDCADCRGKGGGKPDNARGGGKEVSKIEEALQKAKALLVGHAE